MGLLRLLFIMPIPTWPTIYIGPFLLFPILDLTSMKLNRFIYWIMNKIDNFYFYNSFENDNVSIKQKILK